MLFVKDFARMREFYLSVFQSNPVNTQWTDSWAMFDVGGSGFALHAIPAEFTSAPSPTNERKTVKLIFAVEDVPRELARLKALGARTLERSWQDQNESCDCLDPEGNVFQIAARATLPHLFGRN
jgi:predicted enzyme related to lactoylglutathione lyase